MVSTSDPLSTVGETETREPVAWLGQIGGHRFLVFERDGAVGPLAKEVEWTPLAALRTPERDGPTPESIRAMAEWFDNPNKSPTMVVVLPLGGERLTPGFILRRIAETLAAKLSAPMSEETRK